MHTVSEDEIKNLESEAATLSAISASWAVKLNAIDYASATGILAVSWWYVAVLKLIVDALIWIKRKKMEIARKLSKKF